MKKYIIVSKNDFDVKQLKNYKGFEIYKAWWVDFEGNRIKKYPIFYLVQDEEGLIGDEYATLAEAKKYIDSIT